MGNEEVRIAAVYKKPPKSLDTTDIERILDSPLSTIIAGDLNAKHTSWNSSLNNPAGNTLERYISRRTDSTVTAPDTPTHYPDNRSHNPDVLDVAIMKTGSLQYQLENLSSELSSDHTPILLDIQARTSQISPPKPLKVIDWPRFEEVIKVSTQINTKLQNQKQIDEEIDKLTKTITQVLENCTTTYQPTDNKKDLPLAIQVEITHKKRLRRLWQRTRDPAAKTALNRQTGRVKNLLHAHNEENWTSFLNSVEPSQNGWTKLFALNRRLLRRKQSEHPLTDNIGQTHYDSKAKAEIFASAMEEQFKTPSSNPQNQHIEETVRKTIKNHSEEQHENTIFFTPEQTWNKIRKLSNNKAPGPDGITNSALKKCGRKTIIQLTNIFNGCARAQYFPSAWKLAAMIMIQKPGKDPLNPTNHRPIALLNTMAKVLESLLLDRLKLSTTTRPEQHGFRAHHSTTTQLINVIDNITNKYNIRHKTAVALLDIEKAFDKVWHDGLIHKLIKTGTPHQLTNIIRSFLTERKFYIKIADSTSTEKLIKAGVPQGSCLSPQLFSIYINDMPQHPETKTALFADDTLIYASGLTNNAAARRLQKHLHTLELWYNSWKITINPTKTKTILFGNKSTQDTPKIQLQNQNIEWSFSIKYLGIHIDRHLKFSKQVKHATNKAKAAKAILYPVINPKSTIPINNKLYIYKAYIRPILTYAATAWSANISETSWKKLERVQSTTLRQITGQLPFVNNQAIRNSSKIPTIKEIVQKDKLNTIERIRSAPHDHLSDILSRPAPKEHFKLRPLSS